MNIDYKRTDVVIIEGGLTQNATHIPVLDLDVLNEGTWDDSGTMEEVADLLRVAAILGLFQIAGRCLEWLEEWHTEKTKDLTESS